MILSILKVVKPLILWYEIIDFRMGFDFVRLLYIKTEIGATHQKVLPLRFHQNTFI